MYVWKRWDTVGTAGIGRYQESTERLRGALPGRHRGVELELRQKLDEIRRRLGLDAAYG